MGRRDLDVPDHGNAQVSIVIPRLYSAVSVYQKAAPIGALNSFMHLLGFDVANLSSV